MPIDELDRYYSLAFAVAILPDKSQIYVSTAGSDSVTVIDIAKLLRFVHAHPKSFANDLSASSNYVTARIPVGHQPPRHHALSRWIAPLRSESPR